MKEMPESKRIQLEKELDALHDKHNINKFAFLTQKPIRKKSKKVPLAWAAAACALVLFVSVGFYTGLNGNGSKSAEYGNMPNGGSITNDSKKPADLEASPEAAPPAEGSTDSLPDCGGAGNAQNPDSRPGNEQEAGILTAGSWNDNLHWDFWLRLMNSNNGYDNSITAFRLNTSGRYEVKVTSNGAPVKGASVLLYNENAENTPVFKAATDSQGRAYLFENAFCSDITQNGVPDYISVSSGPYTARINITPDKREYQIDLDSSRQAPRQLDLMLIMDTTGSMADELSYLQKELENVLKVIADKNPGLDMRLSVNFYRDDGDEYIVKSNQFTSDLSSAVRILQAQAADGGGDYEEAADEALYDGIYNHQWREESTKILLMVMDAPPHQTDEASRNLIKAIEKAAETGVRIIPVSGSGVNRDTEFLMRALAVLTGGEYVFLTDDSGIGGGHLEPTIGEFQVYKLNELLINLISGYLN